MSGIKEVWSGEVHTVGFKDLQLSSFSKSQSYYWWASFHLQAINHSKTACLSWIASPCLSKGLGSWLALENRLCPQDSSEPNRLTLELSMGVQSGRLEMFMVTWNPSTPVPESLERERKKKVLCVSTMWLTWAPCCHDQHISCQWFWTVTLSSSHLRPLHGFSDKKGGCFKGSLFFPPVRNRRRAP